MRERLELVTDFASLKAGDMVLMKDCQLCSGSAHRGILVAFTRNDWTCDPDGGLYCEDTWEAAPTGPCGVFVFAASDVDQRVIYRIDTSLEDSTSTPTRKKRSVRA